MKPDSTSTQKASNGLNEPFSQVSALPPALPFVPPQLAIDQVEFLPWPTDGRLRGALVYSGRRSMRSFHAQWLWLLASLVVCLPASVFVTAAASPAGILLLALPVLMLLPLLCNSYSWRYQVYEYRIDFETGLLSKRIRSVWLWQIQDVEYTRTAVGWLTNTGTVQILADKRQGNQAAETTSFEIVGLGSSSFLQNLREELIEAALIQRRAIKTILTLRIGWQPSLIYFEQMFRATPSP